MKLLFKDFCLATTLLLLVATNVVGCKKKNKGSGDAPPPVVQPPVVPVKSDVSFYLTQPDRSAMFKKQNIALLFNSSTNNNPTIEIDTTQTFQTIDGFGYTLTGGSASLINALSEERKNTLLQELFSTDSAAIGVSYLRISIGASDLSATPFTYNDLSTAATDLELKQFSIDAERMDLLPVLKKIVAIYPNIKILGSPWTAPVWMKTKNSFVGGSLKPEFYSVYANYFVKYIQAMKAEGITIDAITVQNEPLHDGNNPSMHMTAQEQLDFVKNHLGPAFKNANITTKIIVYDHNADRPDYPITILNDPEARKYVDGSAFHLYGGQISGLSQVRNAHPDKNIYFTEQWIGGPGNFSGDLNWHINNLIIGATRNWSRNVLEWNLAADSNYNPRTQGGCSNCLGAITVSGQTITRNTAYYIIAHASKFARPGSIRIHSSISGSINTVAFKAPDGKKVLIAINNGSTPQTFNIKFNGKIVTTSLNNGAVGTYVW